MVVNVTETVVNFAGSAGHMAEAIGLSFLTVSSIVKIVARDVHETTVDIKRRKEAEKRRKIHGTNGSE